MSAKKVVWFCENSDEKKQINDSNSDYFNKKKIFFSVAALKKTSDYKIKQKVWFKRFVDSTIFPPM